MKRWITSVALAGGLVLTGCATEVTPANNDLNTISPIPETSASLVPKSEQWRYPMFKDYDPQRLARERANVGGAVGVGE